MVVVNENIRSEVYEENNHYYEESLTVSDYWRILQKWKTFILAMVLIAVVLSSGIVLLKYPIKYVTESTIELNFKGIEKHTYPDESPFAQDQIIAPAILAKVVDTLKSVIDETQLNKLRDSIGIRAITPPEIQEKIAQAKKRNDAFEYSPNQFVVSFTTRRHEILGPQVRERILLAIVDEFRKDFEHKFSEEPLVVINFADNMIEKYDYVDVLETLSVKLSNILTFLDAKIQDAGFFRSARTGLSFIDIKNDVQLMESLELGNLEAIIKNGLLTKNKDTLINKYRHKIRSIDFAMRKKEGEAAVARDLLQAMQTAERYDVKTSSAPRNGETNIVIDSSLIKNLIKNDYYSMLLKTALQAEIDAKNLSVEKAFLEEEISHLNQNHFTPLQTEEKMRYVTQKLNFIKDNMASLSQKANELNAEYLKSDIIGVVKVVHYHRTFRQRAINVTLVMLLVAVLAFFLAFFIAIFTEHVRTTANHFPEDDHAINTTPGL